MLPEVGPGDIKKAMQANHRFAWSLWAQVADKNAGNAFLSPVSLSQALAMTAAGAQGETAKELWTAIGYADEADALKSALADESALTRSINAAQDETLKLQTANALWVAMPEKLKPVYADQMKKLFGANAQNLDFSRSEASAKTINKWVASKTNEKIKDLVPASELDKDTRLVLTNAVYFKADWITPFDKKRTHKAPFKLDGTTSVDVDTMRRTIYAHSAQDDGYRLVDLPYKNPRVVFRAIVPKDGSSLAGLDGDRVGRLAESTQLGMVDVHLPKFKMTWSGELTNALKAMGVKQAFSINGDFTPMFEGMSQPTEVSAVMHKAFVEVDEKGTEAAAATFVGVAAGSAPMDPIVFNADRPFLFQIVDKESGAVLFMGRVSDPR
jgi:serpin B